MASSGSGSNFGFLAEHDPLFVELANAAENVFSSDPNTTLIKLRQLGEALAKHLAHVVLDQLNQKIMRVLRKAVAKVENSPQKHSELKQKLDELHTLWGVEPAKLHQHLHSLGPQQAAEFMCQNMGLVKQLNDVKDLIGSDRLPVLSEHQDQILERTQSYGNHQRPEDYLDSFGQFIRDNINQSAALSAVVNKPRDLTREQLKDIKLLLDNAGYTEAKLQTAWRNQTNQDIAASIIGHIRKAALGEALKPFEQRVNDAMQQLYARHPWTPAQKKWLDRLAKQLVFEVILDQEFVNKRFGDQGGAKQLDKVLNGQLDQVLEELAEGIWPEAS